jgi:hypothetical protein
MRFNRTIEHRIKPAEMIVYEQLDHSIVCNPGRIRFYLAPAHTALHMSILDPIDAASRRDASFGPAL